DKTSYLFWLSCLWNLCWFDSVG
ncbi:Glutamine amidotransferase subunit PdxT, partial [Haemophilus influenzae]